MIVTLKTFDILNPNIWKRNSWWKHSKIYICWLWRGLKKNWIIILKYCVITLNIYIFNAFGVKILITNLAFGNKIHKSKIIYYNIERQGISVIYLNIIN